MCETTALFVNEVTTQIELNFSSLLLHQAYSNAAIFKTREPERWMCYERPLDLRNSLILPPSQGSLSPNCCFSIGTECKALQKKPQEA